MHKIVEGILIQIITCRIFMLVPKINNVYKQIAMYFLYITLFIRNCNNKTSTVDP
jgi:hypothetical protein